MLTNPMNSTASPRIIESPKSERKSPDRFLLPSRIKNILKISYGQNSPLQQHLHPTAVGETTKPLYVDEKYDDDTVSFLSDDDGLLLDTHFENDENENSGPFCTFGSTSLRQQQQQQHYIGGNYFFRQSTSADESDCHDVVSFPSEDQHSLNETKDHDHHDSSSSFPKSSSSSPPDAGKATETGLDNNDLRPLVEALEREKSVLSQKCAKLETLVVETRHDHDCYKAEMTMAMGSLQIQMESERDDKAYLLNKCQDLKKELLALRTSYDSKLNIISVMENEFRRQPPRPIVGKSTM